MANKSAPSRRRVLYVKIEAFEKQLEMEARMANILKDSEHITLTMSISRNPKTARTSGERKKYRRCKPTAWELDEKDWQRITNAKTLKKGLQRALVQFFHKRNNAPATGKEIDTFLDYPHQRKVRFIPNHTGGLNDALREANLPYRLFVTVRAWGRKKSLIPYRFFAVT